MVPYAFDQQLIWVASLERFRVFAVFVCHFPEGFNKIVDRFGMSIKGMAFKMLVLCFSIYLYICNLLLVFLWNLLFVNVFKVPFLYTFVRVVSLAGFDTRHIQAQAPQNALAQCEPSIIE